MEEGAIVNMIEFSLKDIEFETALPATGLLGGSRRD